MRTLWRLAIDTAFPYPLTQWRPMERLNLPEEHAIEVPFSKTRNRRLKMERLTESGATGTIT